MQKLELWVDIKGYEGLYKISNFGNIQSLDRQGTHCRILNIRIDSRGYNHVTLYKNNKPMYYRVHRVVAEHFLPKIYGKDFINHIDGNKQNNNVNNLEWCTRGENLKHAFQSKLRVAKTKMIVKMDKNYNVLKIYNSIQEASRDNKLYEPNIVRVVKGRGNTCGGFCWKYIDK